MRTTTISNNLVQLTDHPIVFPINAYLVREEDGYTLVDTGLSATGKALVEKLRAMPLPVVRIALTHAHGDHVGGLDRVHEVFPDAEVAISARDARALAGDLSLDAAAEEVLLVSVQIAVSVAIAIAMVCQSSGRREYVVRASCSSSGR